MSQPYVGEIRMFAGNFAPAGWMFCDGQLLPISQYETLFNLIGTTYGGDGQSTFQLPDLRSRVPLHQGPGFTIGQQAGSETVTLNIQQLPTHTHTANCSAVPGNQTDPGGSFWAYSTKELQYSSAAPGGTMNPNDVSSVGGSQPHDNIQPYLAISFIISLFGIFPSQD